MMRRVCAMRRNVAERIAPLQFRKIGIYWIVAIGPELMARRPAGVAERWFGQPKHRYQQDEQDRAAIENVVHGQRHGLSREYLVDHRQARLAGGAQAL